MAVLHMGHSIFTEKITRNNLSSEINLLKIQFDKNQIVKNSIFLIIVLTTVLTYKCLINVR